MIRADAHHHRQLLRHPLRREQGPVPWLRKQKADFICLQETKAHFHQLADHDIDIPGYKASSTMPNARATQVSPSTHGTSPRASCEGSAYRSSTPRDAISRSQLGRLSVISLYLPSGSAGPQRQASKFRFLEAFAPYLARMRRRRATTSSAATGTSRTGTSTCATGARTRRTRASCPKSERGSTSSSATRATWMPSARSTTKPDQYTWWSNRGQARAKNVGWRIDYQVVSKSLAGKARTAYIYTDKRFSDHAPLIMDYDDLSRAPRRSQSHLLPTARQWRSAAESHWRDSLLVYRQPRVLAMIFLGFSAGLPFYLIFQTLSAWLQTGGHRALDHRHALVGRARVHVQVPVGADRRPRTAAVSHPRAWQAGAAGCCSRRRASRSASSTCRCSEPSQACCTSPCGHWHSHSAQPRRTLRSMRGAVESAHRDDAGRDGRGIPDRLSRRADHCRALVFSSSWIPRTASDSAGTSAMPSWPRSSASVS